MEIINNWCKLHKDKNISEEVGVEYNGGEIILKELDLNLNQIFITKYDVIKKEMSGHDSVLAEDLRDYLRREGIKIYTDKPFKSIKPEWIL